jgi:hypothetical protein
MFDEKKSKIFSLNIIFSTVPAKQAANFFVR